MGNQQSSFSEQDSKEIDLETDLFQQNIDGYESSENQEDEAFFRTVLRLPSESNSPENNDPSDPNVPSTTTNLINDNNDDKSPVDDSDDKSIDGDEDDLDVVQQIEIRSLQDKYKSIDPNMVVHVYRMCQYDKDRTSALINQLAKDFKKQKSLWVRLPSWIKSKILIPKITITNHAHHSIRVTTYGPIDHLIPLKMISHLVNTVETGSVRYRKIPALGAGTLQERHGPHIIVSFAAFPGQTKEHSLFFIGIRPAHGCGAQTFNYPDDFTLFRFNFKTLLLVPGIGSQVSHILNYLVS